MTNLHSHNEKSLSNDWEDNIVLLAKDPNWLFAYWEVPEYKKNDFINEFGQELWEKSVPVLKVTNLTKSTSFLISISDSSDKWYIRVPDSNNLYVAEVGRQISEKYFIGLIRSNYVCTPTNNISANTEAQFINYNSLRKINLDIQPSSAYAYNSDYEFLSGVSSPEMLNRSKPLYKSVGISSAERIGISSAEYVGISSAEAYKAEYVGISSAEYIGISSAEVYKPEYIGISSAEVYRPEYIGISSAEVYKPEYLGISSAEVYKPEYLGISSAEVYRPKYIGISSAEVYKPEYLGISSLELFQNRYRRII